jgi:hypothetical protein
MTDRWLNYVLAVVVIAGMVAYVNYERPRLAEERAEFLDQEVAQRADDLEPEADGEERGAIELRPREQQQVLAVALQNLAVLIKDLIHGAPSHSHIGRRPSTACS